MKDKNERLALVMANYLLDHDEVAACELALFTAKYMAATLQKPEDVFASNCEDDIIGGVMSGISSGVLWPTDFGVCPVPLHTQWFEIAHRALHEAHDGCLHSLKQN